MFNPPAHSLAGCHSARRTVIIISSHYHTENLELRYWVPADSRHYTRLLVVSLVLKQVTIEDRTRALLKTGLQFANQVQILAPKRHRAEEQSRPILEPKCKFVSSPFMRPQIMSSDHELLSEDVRMPARRPTTNQPFLSQPRGSMLIQELKLLVQRAWSEDCN